MQAKFGNKVMNKKITTADATVEKKGVAATTPLLKMVPIKKLMMVSTPLPLPKGRMDMRINTNAIKNITAERAAISNGEIFSLMPHH
jgi:hypothetical protein